MAADRDDPLVDPEAEAVPGGAAFCVFETAIGCCAILWRGAAVIGTLLPEEDEAALRRRIVQRSPSPVEGEAPQHVQQVIDAVRRLLSGQKADVPVAALDFGAAADFERAVWEATLRIPMGETRSYGEIAKSIGAPGAARAVGRALGANPFPIIVPCHRVLASGGRSGGFSAPGGASTKMRMLEIENARRGTDPLLFDRLPWALKS